MRLLKGSILFLFIALLSFALAQDQEDSPTPKRVLKKYRVRRPVIVDDQGNVVRAGPRLRRVRVKNPNKATATETTSQSPVTVVTSTSSSSTTGQTERIIQRQRIQQNQNQQSQNAIPLERQVRPVIYEDHSVVEPARTNPNYRQATSQASRDALLANVKYKPGRGTSSAGEEDRKVGTTRNYSKINDDGSFTFGYEADDGSFKEETRGVDCVVRGKYGYIDPEGVRREFEYVSGNPCDPNEVKDEQADDEEEDSLAPSRPLLRQRVRPAELAENNIQQGQHQTLEERVPEDQLVNFVRPAVRQRIRTNPNAPQQGFVLRQRVRVTTPQPTAPAPTEAQQNEEPSPLFRDRPFFASQRPSVFQEVSQSLEDNRPPFARDLFNFDQEVHRLAAISRPQSQPQPLYEQPFRQVVHQPSPSGRQVFGNIAFRQEQATAAPPTTAAPSTSTTSSGNGNNNFGRYRTELVYDPSSGQYTSVIVQNNNPHSNQEFELTQKLRAFVQPTQPTPTSPSAPQNHFSPSSGSGAFTQIQQFGQPQVQYYHQQGRSAQPAPQQSYQQAAPQSYQHQQSAPQSYQHQQSAPQNYQQSAPQTLQFIPPHLRPMPHQTAEIQQQEVREISFPHRLGGSGIGANSAAASNGQIDAFLRALNIAI